MYKIDEACSRHKGREMRRHAPVSIFLMTMLQSIAPLMNPNYQPGILWARLYVDTNATQFPPFQQQQILGAIVPFPDTTAVILLPLSSLNSTLPPPPNPCAFANSTTQCQEGLVAPATTIAVPNASATPIVNFTLIGPSNTTALMAVLISESPLFWSAAFTRLLLIRTTVSALRNLTTASLFAGDPTNVTSLPCTYATSPSGPVCMRCSNLAPNSSAKVQWTPDWYVNDTCRLAVPTSPPSSSSSSSLSPKTTPAPTTTATIIPPTTPTPEPPPLLVEGPPLLWIVVAAGGGAVVLIASYATMRIRYGHPVVPFLGHYAAVPTADPGNDTPPPITSPPDHPNAPLIMPDGTIRVKIH